MAWGRRAGKKCQYILEKSGRAQRGGATINAKNRDGPCDTQPSRKMVNGGLLPAPPGAELGDSDSQHVITKEEYRLQYTARKKQSLNMVPENRLARRRNETYRN